MKITSQVKIIFSFWDHLNHENSHFGHFRPKMNNGTLQFWLFLNHCLHRSVRTTLTNLTIRSRRGNRSVLDWDFLQAYFWNVYVQIQISSRTAQLVILRRRRNIQKITTFNSTWKKQQYQPCVNTFTRRNSRRPSKWNSMVEHRFEKYCGENRFEVEFVSMKPVLRVNFFEVIFFSKNTQLPWTSTLFSIFHQLHFFFQNKIKQMFNSPQHQLAFVMTR